MEDRIDVEKGKMHKHLPKTHAPTEQITPRGELVNKSLLFVLELLILLGALFFCEQTLSFCEMLEAELLDSRWPSGT